MVIELNGKKYISIEEHRKIIAQVASELSRVYQEQLNEVYTELDNTRRIINR